MIAKKKKNPNIAGIVSSLSVLLLKATVTSVLEYLISWFGEKKFTPELVIITYCNYLHMNALNKG